MPINQLWASAIPVGILSEDVCHGASLAVLLASCRKAPLSAGCLGDAKDPGVGNLTEFWDVGHGQGLGCGSVGKLNIRQHYKDYAYLLCRIRSICNICNNIIKLKYE
jgi:hypothetical protein